MSYTFEKTNSYTGVLHFEIPAETIEEEARKAYYADRAKYPIPGFRRGKAPRKVIEQYFGQVFTDKAIDELMNSSFKQALDEGAPNPVTQPAAKNLNIGEDGKATFDIEYQVLPDVELGDYMGLTVEVNEETLTDDAVENAIQREITRNTRYVPVTDRPIKMDDRVRFDYAGTIDGVAFEGGSQENATLDIGSGKFIPGFEEGLVGLSVDEEKDLELTFPDPYPNNEELSGKPVTFVVTLNSISEEVEPELNDAFVKENFEENYGWTTVAEMRSGVEETLKENAMYDYLFTQIEDFEVSEVPEALFQYQANNMKAYYEQMATMYGMTLDDFVSGMGIGTMDDIVETAREQLTASARSMLIYQAIAEDAGLSVTDEDIKAEFADMEESEYQDIVDHYGMPYIKCILLNNKVADFVYDSAVVE